MIDITLLWVKALVNIIIRWLWNTSKPLSVIFSHSNSRRPISSKEPSRQNGQRYSSIEWLHHCSSLNQSSRQNHSHTILENLWSRHLTWFLMESASVPNDQRLSSITTTVIIASYRNAGGIFKATLRKSIGRKYQEKHSKRSVVVKKAQLSQEDSWIAKDKNTDWD